MTPQISTYDADQAELLRLRRLSRQLVRLAYLFERFGGNCKGDCTVTTNIALCEATGEWITCCHLHAPAQRYHETKGLERVMSSKVNAGRQAHTVEQNRKVEAPLNDLYPRTFTSTYVGKKLKVDGYDVVEGWTEEDQTALLPKLSTSGA